MSTLKVGTIQSTAGNTGLTIANDGTTLPKACAFFMSPNQNQSIANSTETQVTFEVANYDTNSIIDLSNNRVVITTATAGLWFLSFTTRLNSSVPFRHYNIIKKNGNDLVVYEQANYSQTTGAYQSCTVQGTFNLVNSDALTFFIYQGQGSTKNMQNGTNSGNGVEVSASGFRVGTL